MFATKGVKDTIKGHQCCDISEATAPGRLMDCENCPYNDNEHMIDHCVDRLNNDVQYYLFQAEKLIRESENKDQPPLPGVFQEEPSQKRNNNNYSKKKKHSHDNGK